MGIRFFYFLVLSGLVQAFFLSSCGDFQKVPERIEHFSGRGFLGKTVAFSAADCEKTLIIVGASFCLYCKGELEIVEALFREKKLCAFYVGEEESEEDFDRFIEKMKITFPAAFWNYEMMNALGNPRGVPANFIVLRDGRVSFFGLGALTSDSLKRLMNLTP